MGAEGPSLGGSASGWSNSSSVLSKLDAGAAASILATSAEKLFVGQFGFAIPAGSHLTGVMVRLGLTGLGHAELGGAATVNVALSKNGSTVGAAPRTATGSNSDLAGDFGDSGTLFGYSSITAEEANDPLFSVAVWIDPFVPDPEIPGGTTVYVDWLEATAYYAEDSQEPGQEPGQEPVQQGSGGGGSGGSGGRMSISSRMKAAKPTDLSDIPEIDMPDEPLLEDEEEPCFDVPKGFEDPQYRKLCAQRLCNEIESVRSDRAAKFDRYQLAQDICDGKWTMSALDFIEDVDPYNIALLDVRVEGVVEDVSGTFRKSSPYWLVTGGDSDSEREAAEHDLHMAMERAGISLKAPQTGRVAAIWGRGPFRLSYRTLRKEEPEWCDYYGECDPAYAGGEIVSSGLEITPIPAVDFYPYPSYADTLVKCRSVGHRFDSSPHDIKARQDACEYLSDWEPVAPGSGASATIVLPEDEPTDLYEIYTWLSPERLEGSEDELPRRAFKVILAFDAQELLAIEEFTLPRPPYFMPGLREDICEIWPEESVGTKLIEPQTIYNDANSLDIFAGAAAAFPTMMATNWSGSGSQVADLGIAKVVQYRGNPTFTAVPSTYNGAVQAKLKQDMERVADAISKKSSLGQGQEMKPGGTATEASILAAADAAGETDYRAIFGSEWTKAAHFALLLLALNFDDFRAFHGSQVRAPDKLAYLRRYTLQINGQSPSNSPPMVIEKVKTLVQAAQELGAIVVPATKQISADGVIEAIVNELDLASGTAHILQEAPIASPQIANGDIQDPVAAILAAGGAQGAGGQLLADQPGAAPPAVLGAVPGQGPQ